MRKILICLSLFLASCVNLSPPINEAQNVPESNSQSQAVVIAAPAAVNTTVQSVVIKSPAVNNSECQIAPGIINFPNYKKKVAIAAFPLVHSQGTPDIPTLSYELPLLLARNLRASGEFIVRDIEEINLFDNSPVIPYLMAPRTEPLQEISRIVDIAAKIDAQFIISGAIYDFSFRPSNFSLLGLAFDERVVRMELFIHDGWSGALIDKQIFDAQVRGTVSFPEPVHLDSAAFRESDLGKAVQKIINSQVQQIKTKLNLFPLAEKVLRVADNTVIFNAGAEQNLNVGDVFLIFSTADQYRDAVYYQNTRLRGYRETAKSQLTVQQVQPLFSIGELDIPGAVYPGDIVRSW